MRRPAMAFRGCSRCDSYAHHACQAWDQASGQICDRPLCDYHARHRAALVFCADHARLPPVAPRPLHPAPEPDQRGLFDPPEF